MDTTDLTSSMQDMLAEIANMRAELTNLKARSNALVQPAQNMKSTITNTRRTTLKRLGLALLGGAAAATALGQSPVQAKVIANPQANNFANRVGMLVVPPGSTPPSGSLVGSNTYGLLVSADTTAFDLSTFFTENTGIYATSTNGTAVGAISKNGTGVKGSGGTYGVAGDGGTYGVYGASDIYGVYGNGHIGVNGQGDGTANNTGVSGTGLTGVSGTGSGAGSTGVYGTGAQYAGLFAGDVHLTGTLTGGTKSFKIDHPLDPANKYLYHTSIESPDMKNVYDGVVTLNEQGEATIEMPNWFEALNSDFRYQLTCLAEYAPVFVSREIANHQFKIAGGKDGLRVSWQVTGIRQDAYAKAHRSPVEVDKSDKEKGKYLHPELFGQPEEKAVHPRPVAAK